MCSTLNVTDASVDMYYVNLTLDIDICVDTYHVSVAMTQVSPFMSMLCVQPVFFLFFPVLNTSQ